MDDYDVPRPSGHLKSSFNKETNSRNSNEKTHFAYSVTSQVDSEVEDYQIPSPFRVSEEQPKVESNELVLSPLYSQPKKEKKNSPSTGSYGSSGIGTLNRESTIRYDVPRELSDEMFREIQVNVDADSDYDEVPTHIVDICQKSDEADYDHVAAMSCSDETDSSSVVDDASSEEGVYNVPPFSSGEGIYDEPPSSEDVVIYNIPTSSNQHKVGDNIAKVEVILCAKTVIEMNKLQPDVNQHLQTVSSSTDQNVTPIVLTPSHNDQPESINSSAPPEDGDDMVSVDFNSPEEEVVHWEEHEDNLKNKLKKYLTINTISHTSQNPTKARKPSVAERKIVSFCVPLMTIGVLLTSILVIAWLVSYLYFGYQFGYIKL